ncbi:hypothetical protein INR49_019891, partial [Caranx melampygus]
MAASTTATTVLPPVKSVMVYRNGDPFYNGRSYLNVGAKKLPAARKETQAKVTQRPNVSAKWRKFIPVPLIIHMQQDLEQILSLITEKVSLRTGAVRRLCSLEGATVSSAGELETGRCYVAVGTERFKKLPYVELLVSKAAERYYPGKRKLLRRAENRKAGSGPEDQYSDSALLDSPESTGDEAAPPQDTQQRSGRQGADETSAFFARPVKIRKNRGQTRLPLSNGSVQPSVFKRAARRRREEVQGAEEVQEDENTATELPVDQRVAEVVEDEELNSTDDPLHGTEQAQASEQNGVEQTKDSARTERPTLNIQEPEVKHTSSTSGLHHPPLRERMGQKRKGLVQPHSTDTSRRLSSSTAKHGSDSPSPLEPLVVLNCSMWFPSMLFSSALGSGRPYSVAEFELAMLPDT